MKCISLIKALVTPWKNAGPPELLLVLFMGACFVGWWTAEETKDQCRELVLNYQPITAQNFSTVSSPFAMDELDSTDETNLFNLTNFEFLTEASCSSDYLIVVLVTSAPQHVHLRNAIRQTWGAFVKLFFLVGLATDRPLNSLSTEHSTYGDLVVGRFLDRYETLTYKSIMALKWVVYRCRTARYILKLDDDVVVNPVALQKFLRRHLSPFGARNLLLCRTFVGAGRIVHRTGRSKFRLRRTEYRDDYFPHFCEGAAILLSPDVVFKLYSEAQRQTVPYVVFEDVFLTGLVAARINLTHSEIGYHLRDSVHIDNPCNFRKERFLFICIFNHLRAPGLRQFWKLVNRTYSKIPYVSHMPHLPLSPPSS